MLTNVEMDPHATVTRRDISRAARELGLSGEPACVHSSLRSFGRVEGGAPAVVEGLLDEGCTVLVPTFWGKYECSPPADWRPSRNALNYETVRGRTPLTGPAYSPETREIDRSMGALPAAVIQMPGRIRGSHPTSSLAAIGPLARELISTQTPLDVFAPLGALAEANGWIILMGVGLNRMTLIHVAEKRAGRTLFRRWAYGLDGRPIEIECGGCSEGFDNFEPVLGPLARESKVGQSLWRVFPARETLDAAAKAIRENPSITRCADPGCIRCADSIAGGPILTQ
jgi:aminoglycoside 3-N-acetyltransferase